MINKLFIILFLLLTLIAGCKKSIQNNSLSSKEDNDSVRYAKGFSIKKYNLYTLIKVTSPWHNSGSSFTYVLAKEKNKLPDSLLHLPFIKIPVKRIVTTSTTHIPALEALNVEKTLVGFPGTEYISSAKTRIRIEQDKVKEVGSNEHINTEILIDLQPNVLFGFGINNQNKSYKTIEKSGIPVVYNGDWTEQTPLGKAEWIKFFAPFFEKEQLADSIFNTIEKTYLDTKKLIKKNTHLPTVMSGALYKDVWYTPAGNSWAAHFINDAGANYLWKSNKNTGSLSLSMETVFEKAQKADVWINPSQFTTYKELIAANSHYRQFDAFKNRKIYTFSNTKGKTGGILYYELGPHRPDLILKDLIKIFHPETLPDYSPTFFKPLL